MTNAEAVARYFLWLAASEPEDEPVTHLRLQKLMYYAQGWSLGSRGVPLFDGVIEAWQHGPVVREVYPRFADYGGEPIPRSEAQESEELTVADRALVQWVWDRYGCYSASELRRRTHGEPPWLRARGSAPENAACTATIDLGVMRSHFRAERLKLLRENGFDADALDAAIEDARAGRTIPLDELAKELSGGVAH
jgi:uncharacterized phage-associated protein